MATAQPTGALPKEQYTVGWICALPTELTAARFFLDDLHAERLEQQDTRDDNAHVLGSIKGHNVAIATLPYGIYGTSSAASVARDMLRTFKNIRIGLMVGIGGGAPTPTNNVQLGDVVVSVPQNGNVGIFQYQHGKNIQDRSFQYTGHLNKPTALLLGAVASLKSKFTINGNRIAESVDALVTKYPRLQSEFGRPHPTSDRLYNSDFIHLDDENGLHRSCDAVCGFGSARIVDRTGWPKRYDKSVVFHGVIASADILMKNAKERDTLSHETGVLCFEMEASGLMDRFPCLVVRGICDYSDTHKNDQWQGYAAMCAAAYTKELLAMVAPSKVDTEQKLETRLDSKTQQSQLVQWLNPFDFSTYHREACEQHFQNSGSWLLNDEQFQRWLGPSQNFLWLYGSPGCGKTVLSSSIIRAVGKTHLLLHFYITFHQKDTLSIHTLIRTLVWQLSQKFNATRSVLDDLYTSCKDSDPEKTPRPPTTEELQRVFLNMLRLVKEVWIVIDALDELVLEGSKKDAKNAMTWITDLVNLKNGNAHLAVTSRDEQEIRKYFQKIVARNGFIAVEGEGLDGDIAAYVKNEVAGLERWKNSPTIQMEIENKLLAKANGMFRYVACQIKELEDCLDPTALSEALENLPKDLNETYARILARMPDHYEANTICVLQFLLYSPKPLSIEELVDAVAVRVDEPTAFHPAYRMPEPIEVTKYCSSLIKLVTPDPENITGAKVRLAHFTVQEYLVKYSNHSDKFTEMVARASMAVVCMSYLRHVDYDLPVSQLEISFPFIRYSSKNWMAYAAASEHEKGILAKTTDFMRDCKNACHKKWTYIYGCKEHEDLIGSLVWRACTEGLNPLCLQHLDIRTYARSNTASYERDSPSLRTAMDHACQVGDLRWIRFLFENGGLRCYWSGQFQAPCSTGNEAVVEMMLEMGACLDVDDGHNYGCHAFVFACQSGCRRVVEMLIKHRPEFVNVHSREEGMPLSCAIGARKDDIALLLLEHGAELGWEFDVADNQAYLFQLLIKQGLIEHLQKLVTEDPEDLELKHLELAVETGNARIVRLLCETKIFQKESLNRALLTAAKGGHAETHSLLQGFMEKQPPKSVAVTKAVTKAVTEPIERRELRVGDQNPKQEQKGKSRHHTRKTKHKTAHARQPSRVLPEDRPSRNRSKHGRHVSHSRSILSDPVWKKAWKRLLMSEEKATYYTVEVCRIDTVRQAPCIALGLEQKADSVSSNTKQVLIIERWIAACQHEVTSFVQDYEALMWAENRKACKEFLNNFTTGPDPTWGFYVYTTYTHPQEQEEVNSDQNSSPDKKGVVDDNTYFQKLLDKFHDLATENLRDSHPVSYNQGMIDTVLLIPAAIMPNALLSERLFEPGYQDTYNEEGLFSPKHEWCMVIDDEALESFDADDGDDTFVKLLSGDYMEMKKPVAITAKYRDGTGEIQCNGWFKFSASMLKDVFEVVMREKLSRIFVGKMNFVVFDVSIAD
ncbi:hypothetical protein PSV09DRAFT_2258257 [Bipolaris maydis]|nr:hypothetical protein PSV09DRAFT_2258257 [Bipolaris maydis]